MDGLLYVVSEKSLTQEEVLLLVAPAGVRQKVLNMSHDAKTVGHLGRDRTLAKSTTCTGQGWPTMLPGGVDSVTGVHEGNQVREGLSFLCNT